MHVVICVQDGDEGEHVDELFLGELTRLACANKSAEDIVEACDRSMILT